MSEKLVQFTNCRLLRDHKFIEEDLWVRDGRIINHEKVFYDEKVQADTVIDCGGNIIAPGLIELQINGGYGYDFSYTDNIEEAVNKVAKELTCQGVTSFCPTLVTSPKEVYHKILPKIQRRRGDKNGATILGLHLEGPFINKDKKGAHPSEYIISLEEGISTLEKIYGGLENTQIITLAPEIAKNSNQVIEELRKRKIIVSLGHSTANLAQGEEAVKHGANFITHLFNAMLPFHHRDPGLVGLLASEEIPEGTTIYFGIIADGIHTHPAALRIAHRVHPSGLVLVTDAISAMGLTEGKHTIGQMSIEIKDNVAYVAGTNTLCGSVATMIQCVRHFREATGCSPEYALETASLHPALALGISDKKGTLSFGADADFIILDDALILQSTYIAGERVYSK